MFLLIPCHRETWFVELNFGSAFCNDNMSHTCVFNSVVLQQATFILLFLLIPCHRDGFFHSRLLKYYVVVEQGEYKLIILC